MNIEIISFKKLLEESISRDVLKDPDTIYCVTHSGNFHCDDVFATALLLLAFGNIKLSRISSISSDLPVNMICYDIGYGRYDHHQSEGNGQRENGVPFSSFGLIYKDFGMRAIRNVSQCTDEDYLEECYKYLETEVVCSVDAADNGRLPSISNLSYSIPGLSSVIKSFLPLSQGAQENNDCFLRAVNFSAEYLSRLILKDINNIFSKNYILKVLSQHSNENNNILVLHKNVPWKNALFNSPNFSNIFFVVYPSNRNNGYNVKAVNRSPFSNEFKKLFPKSWGGLEDSALQRVSGVQTAIFCHRNLFLCGAKTLEDAKKLAEYAMNC